MWIQMLAAVNGYTEVRNNMEGNRVGMALSQEIVNYLLHNSAPTQNKPVLK